MAKTTQYDTIETTARCKICIHPDRDEIEKLIRQKVTFGKICERFRDLNEQNCSSHWTNHMIPAIRVKSSITVEEMGLEVKDSINELTKLLTQSDRVFEELIRNIDPKSEDYLQQINAMRGLINAKTAMIKLNMTLIGDTKSTRDQINIVAALEAAKKQILEVDRSKIVAEYREKGK